MDVFPITHYEHIISNPEKYLGCDIKTFMNIMKTKDFDFLDFKEMIESKSIFDFKNHLEQGNMAARMFYHIIRLYHCGEKIYYLPKDVCKLVSNTRLTIDSEFVESPFEEIYLYTDQDDLMMTDHTGTKAMKGIYVSVRTESDGIKKVRFLATSGAEDIDDMKDVNIYACFHIPEHGNLEEICRDQLDKYGKSNFFDKKYKVADDTYVEVFKFLINALLYIGCRNASLIPMTPFTVEQLTSGKGPKKAKKIINRMARKAKRPFIYVGRKTLDGSPTYTGLGRALDHEVMVGGHWRGQWYGPADNRRKKVIRISSYVKGAGLGPVENKKYIVK